MRSSSSSCSFSAVKLAARGTGRPGLARAGGLPDPLRELADHLDFVPNVPSWQVVDDVVVEPESVVRAACFADLCRRPTIVGGHMFNLLDRSVLHAFAENVFHVGGPGAGHIIKLLNNFIAQAICTATA